MLVDELGSRDFVSVLTGVGLAVVTVPVVVGYVALGAGVLVGGSLVELARQARRLLPLGTSDAKPRTPTAGG